MWFTRQSKKQRRAALAIAATEQEREQRDARRRVLDQATVMLPVVEVRRAPLLTHAQAYRAGSE